MSATILAFHNHSGTPAVHMKPISGLSFGVVKGQINSPAVLVCILESCCCPIKSCCLCLRRVAVHHVKVKPRCAVLTMLKRLDKIRFRGPRTRDDFPDLAESPPASDNECSDDVQPKPRTALRDTEDLLRDPVSVVLRFYFIFKTQYPENDFALESKPISLICLYSKENASLMADEDRTETFI